MKWRPRRNIAEYFFWIYGAEVADERRIEDLQVLKGLTQPMRQRLYRLLIQLGPATVGTLAKKVNGDPGLVSYHLRELGRHGFIEEAPEMSTDRRERWWRAVKGSTRWSALDFQTPEGKAVATTLKAQAISDEVERLRQFEENRESWSPAWLDAAMDSQTYLRLTPAELKKLGEELQALFVRWSQAGRTSSDTGDREPVFLFLHAFPENPK
jgi:DNA-binding transcriptional ArsR family regulator